MKKRKTLTIMRNRKPLSTKELEKVDGGWYCIPSWEKPSICPICKAELIDHPDGMDFNGHPVLVCKSNINNKDHWVLWQRRR